MKVGTLICMIIMLIGCFSSCSFDTSNTFVSAIVICAITIVLKLACGGWSAHTIKSMLWSVTLSTIGAVALVIAGMKQGDHSISYIMLFVPIIIALIGGIASYRMIDNALTEQYCEDVTGEDILDSVVNYGLKNTFNAFTADIEENMYYSVSRGVAVYSNLAMIIGLIMYFVYR